jgi:hypothetical protein
MSCHYSSLYSVLDLISNYNVDVQRTVYLNTFRVFQNGWIVLTVSSTTNSDGSVGAGVVVVVGGSVVPSGTILVVISGMKSTAVVEAAAVVVIVSVVVGTSMGAGGLAMYALSASAIILRNFGSIPTQNPVQLSRSCK